MTSRNPQLIFSSFFFYPMVFSVFHNPLHLPILSKLSTSLHILNQNFTFKTSGEDFVESFITKLKSLKSIFCYYKEHLPYIKHKKPDSNEEWICWCFEVKNNLFNSIYITPQWLQLIVLNMCNNFWCFLKAYHFLQGIFRIWW